MSLYGTFHRFFVWPRLERREGQVTKGHAELLARSEGWSRDELEAFQWQRLRLVLKNAFENTSFYKKRFDDLGLNPEDIRSMEDFQKIPPLSRQDIIEHLEELTARNVTEADRHVSSTGGSTGLATRFVRDNACLPVKMASEYRFNTWTGWRPGEKILYYWPALADFAVQTNKLPMLRSLAYSRSLLLYSGRLNEIILQEHLAAWQRFQPLLVRAFPSALEQFLQFAIRTKARIPSPQGIICVGEPLLPAQRQLFSESLQCAVFNCYVSRECGNIASECAEHEGLHVAEEMIHLEIDSRKEGDFGEILLTDLWNMGMPFIRYRIQDAARWLDGACPCGRNHRRMGVEAARLSDFLISPVDNALVSGSTLLHYLLAEGVSVGRVKLIQDGPNHLRVITAGDLAANQEAIKHIRARLDVIFKGQMQVDFEFVKEIPLLASGKYRFVERTF